jgi:alcohol dehydrogenase (cytochrome c)
VQERWEIDDGTQRLELLHFGHGHAATGERRWEFRYPSATMAGVMSTASGLVFAGDNEGNFIAFDSRTGEHLWHYPTGTAIWGAAAMTHVLDGRQHVLIPSGGTLIAFALLEQ